MGSQPPQASEDSFSDDEDDLTGHEAQANEKQENKTGLPRHIMERLEKRRTKEGRKAERQARSNRARKAQEIQRELEELEVEQVDGIIIIIITRPKPAYGRQGLAGRIVGPRYRSSGYLLGCCQHLTMRLQRSARMKTNLEP